MSGMEDSQVIAISSFYSYPLPMLYFFFARKVCAAASQETRSYSSLSTLLRTGFASVALVASCPLGGAAT